MNGADRFDFTLDEETEKRLYDLMTDIDTRRTNRFWIKDKRGYHAEYVKVIQCKDCKYYLKSNEECQLIKTRLHFYEEDKRWTEDSFCAWAERKDNETD